MKLKLVIVLMTFAFAFAIAAGEPPPGNLDDGIAVHGYDPVSYFSATGPMKGKKEISSAYRGATYHFATSENLAAFQKTPAKFEPAYGGWCAYAMAASDKVDVDPKTFKVIDGKVYLFYNGFLGNTLKKWDKKEAELKPKADEAWSKLAATIPEKK